MMTELLSVLFHGSLCSFRRTQAFVTSLECTILLLDNNLPLHAFVPETAGMATLERIRAWRLGQEVDHGRFSFLELPTVLRGSEN